MSSFKRAVFSAIVIWQSGCIGNYNVLYITEQIFSVWFVTTTSRSLMKVIEYWPSLVITKLGFYMQRLSIMMYALSNSCVFSIIQGKQKLLCGVMSDIILNVSRTFKFITFLIISWLRILLFQFLKCNIKQIDFSLFYKLPSDIDIK